MQRLAEVAAPVIDKETLGGDSRPAFMLGCAIVSFHSAQAESCGPKGLSGREGEEFARKGEGKAGHSPTEPRQSGR